MEQQGMSESRFYMWRAVFALAHADGILTDKERAFVEGYLDRLPLSEEQKKILRDDLKHPQSINEMLIGVRDNDDHADFFQFAQMIVWCDGDYEAQEQRIIERMTAEQMNRFNRQEIASALQQGRMAANLRRSIESDEFEKQAENTGLFAKWRRGPEHRGKAGTIAGTEMKRTLRGAATLLGLKVKEESEAEANNMEAAIEWMRQQAFSAPSAEVFALWRAIFSLAHADGKVTRAEEEYIHGMMQVFRFTKEQKETVESDLQSPVDPLHLFRALQTPELRREFFIAAQTIMWCDYEFSDQERDVMNALVALLSSGEQEDFKKDLAWISKNPPPPPSEDEDGGKAMKGLLARMTAWHTGD